MRLRSLVALLIAFTTLGLPAAPASADTVTLSETGSTLFYPLFRLWVGQYEKVTPTVRIGLGATGSEAGVAQAMSGAVQLGASDAFMTDEQLGNNPQVMNIPLAIAAETINYNIPGLNGTPLKIDGPSLAGIYSGTIRYWDAQQIAALNPGVKLPHHVIVPIHRSDGSGSTFLFTQYLSFSTPDWSDKGPGFGTTIQWPAVDGTVAVAGNPAMVRATAQHPYSVSYIGTSLHGQIAKAGIGTALVGNQAGKFLLPTPDTVRAGASELDRRTPPDERLSLVYAPGDNSYPIIGYEYVIVSQKQANPAVAAAIRAFLLWAIDDRNGNSEKYLGAVQFIALPDYIRALSIAQINKIQ
jgi:phosphate transport system substrate-binding protein